MGFVEAVERVLPVLPAKVRDDLGPALRALEERCRRAHPLLRWDDEKLSAFFVERLPEGEGELATAVAALRGPDLFLAWACLDGQSAALSAFERELMPQVAQALRGIDRDSTFVDETSNATRTRLLVADGARRPGLELYLGHGPLAAFAMVVAMRLATDQKRAIGPSETLSAALAMSDGRRSQEGLLGDAEVRGKVKQALLNATAALTPRERALLKLHLLEGVSAQKLAVMYGVHRATATRWLTDARQKAMERMTQELKRELNVGESTFASLKAELVDGLDLTLTGVLTAAEPPPEP